MGDLIFRFMTLGDVLSAGPKKSKSSLFDAVKKGRAPEPDRIDGRTLWRSDRVAAWIEAEAAKADAEREERNRRARSKAQRMVAGRRTSAAA
jgi:predicted DNA-binding transcriptional regulator AlpA